MAARRGNVLEELARECADTGGVAYAIPTDVSKRSDVDRLTEAAVSRFGRVDVWINNAGVAALGRFEKVPLDDHAQVISTSLLKTLYGSHLAYRLFLAQGAGILINVASELGQFSAPYYASYVAAKHGVVGLGQALRQEIDQNNVGGVHVCTVMPSAHDTPFFDHVANYSGHEGTAAEARSMIPAMWSRHC
jgi:short-subunit dehydrogenase